MRSKNLLVYESVWDISEQLTDSQVSCLFRGLNEWRKGNEPVFNDPLIQGIWLGLRPNMLMLEENYNKKVSANRENGKLGGRPKKTETNPQNPSGFLETHTNPQNLKDKDKDKEKEKDIDIEKDIDKELDRILEAKNIK